jgi:hypothetical protein
MVFAVVPVAVTTSRKGLMPQRSMTQADDRQTASAQSLCMFSHARSVPALVSSVTMFAVVSVLRMKTQSPSLLAEAGKLATMAPLVASA